MYNSWTPLALGRSQWYWMQRTPSDRSYTRYNCNRSVWFRKALLDNGIHYLVKSCFDKNTGKKTIENKVRKQLRIKDEKVTKKAKLIWGGIWSQTNDENCHPTLTSHRYQALLAVHAHAHWGVQCTMQQGFLLARVEKGHKSLCHGMCRLPAQRRGKI